MAILFIGGLAVLRWGEPRETIDVDVTLLTGFGGEEPYIQTLLAHYAARIPNAAAFALNRRVLLVRTIPVSVWISPWEVCLLKNPVSRTPISPFRTR